MIGYAAQSSREATAGDFIFARTGCMWPIRPPPTCIPRTRVRGYGMPSLRDSRCCHAGYLGLASEATACHRCAIHGAAVLDTSDSRPRLRHAIAARFTVLPCWIPRTRVRGYGMPSLRDSRCCRAGYLGLASEANAYRAYGTKSASLAPLTHSTTQTLTHCPTHPLPYSPTPLLPYSPTCLP